MVMENYFKVLLLLTRVIQFITINIDMYTPGAFTTYFSKNRYYKPVSRP